MFYLLRCVKVCLCKVKNVVYFGERSLWENNVCSAVVGWSVLQISFTSSWLMVLVNQHHHNLTVFCLLGLSIIDIASSYNHGLVYFSLQFYQFLPHIFWHFLVGHIHIKDCYVFLGNWPLYHHVILSLIVFFVLKSAWLILILLLQLSFD